MAMPRHTLLEFEPALVFSSPTSAGNNRSCVDLCGRVQATIWRSRAKFSAPKRSGALSRLNEMHGRH
jgi:hypothetical protein